MGKRGIVVYCGLLMSLSAFSIDITLPFFSRIADSLGMPLTSMPLTVTVLLLFLGLMQIVFGPVSDRYGRKVALIAGLCIFLIGSVVASVSSNFTLLIVGRALQGIGASAAFVTSRSILRDLSTGADLARQMSLATAIFSVGPIVAPLLGALLILVGGEWRWVFTAMLAYAAVLLFILVFFVPETNRNRNRQAMHWTTLAENLLVVVRHPQSRWFMLVNAVTQISMILIIATAAPLYKLEFDVSGIQFALFFSLHAVGIIFGQMLNRWLIPRYGPLLSAMMASLFMISAGLLVIITALAGLASAAVFTALVTLFAFGYLSVSANSTAIALMPHPGIAGFSASLLGSFGMLVAASMGMLIGWFVQTSALYWGIAITLIPVVSLAMMYAWYRNRGRLLDTGQKA